MTTDELHSDEREQHQADGASHGAVVHVRDEQGTQDDTYRQPRKEPGEQPPVRMSPVGSHRDDVSDHQERQQCARRLARR